MPDTGGLIPTVDADTCHDLTDAQGVLLEPLLPAPSRQGQPRRYTLRDLINGIFAITREANSTVT